MKTGLVSPKGRSIEHGRDSPMDHYAQCVTRPG